MESGAAQAEAQAKAGKGSLIDGAGGFVHAFTLGAVSFGNPHTARYRGGEDAAMIPVDPDSLVVDSDRLGSKLLVEGTDSLTVVEDGRRYWTTSTEFRGTRVYQRDDLIDPTRVDKRGRTSAERMAKGLPPIGSDGEPIQLHHTIQTNDSPLAEVTGTFHRTNNKVLHINPHTIPSGIDRPGFDGFRRGYWAQRGAGLGP